MKAHIGSIIAGIVALVAATLVSRLVGLPSPWVDALNVVFAGMAAFSWEFFTDRTVDFGAPFHRRYLPFMPRRLSYLAMEQVDADHWVVKVARSDPKNVVTLTWREKISVFFRRRL